MTPARPDRDDLDPRLLARLARPLVQAGLVRLTIGARILAAVEALQARRALAAELMRRRGVRPGFDKAQVPIVHARRSDEPRSAAAEPRSATDVVRERVVVQAQTVERVALQASPAAMLGTAAPGQATTAAAVADRTSAVPAARSGALVDVVTRTSHERVVVTASARAPEHDPIVSVAPVAAVAPCPERPPLVQGLHAAPVGGTTDLVLAAPAATRRVVRPALDATRVDGGDDAVIAAAGLPAAVVRVAPQDPQRSSTPMVHAARGGSAPSAPAPAIPAAVDLAPRLVSGPRGSHAPGAAVPGAPVPTTAAPAASRAAAPPRIDLDELAEKVQGRILRQIAQERTRRGYSR